MANLVSRDVQTTTGTNLRLIERETGLSAWITGQVKLKDALVQKETVPVEEREKWRNKNSYIWGRILKTSVD